MASSEPVPACQLPPPASGAGRDPWHGLARFTPARVALGRAGGSVHSGTLLDFRLAHARARDAVLMDFHAERVESGIARTGLAAVRLATAATDRRTFLLRPDLGRKLSDASHAALAGHRSGWGPRDLAIIVSDGLSALAAERQAVPTLQYLVPRLEDAGWSLFPIFVAPFARVKLQDEIGGLLGARHALMLLGERPGLGVPDSLGAYFTFQPRADRTDADRNCISNIRPEGLPPAAAAGKLAQLLIESARLGLSGIALKDFTSLPPTAASAALE